MTYDGCLATVIDSRDMACLSYLFGATQYVVINFNMLLIMQWAQSRSV